jgi:hypothetical protein
MERPLEPGTSTLMYYGHDTDEEPRPVRELYGAFRRPRNDADRVGEALAAVAWSGIPWGAEIAMDEGRVFLSGLGGEEDTIYAAPLGDDRLVVAVLPNGGGGSTRPGPDGLFMLTSQLETGDLVIRGVVDDEVASVDLVVSGVTHRAAMGENSFGLRLVDTHEADQERLILHRRDGTTNEVPLSPQPNA